MPARGAVGAPSALSMASLPPFILTVTPQTHPESAEGAGGRGTEKNLTRFWAKRGALGNGKQPRLPGVPGWRGRWWWWWTEGMRPEPVATVRHLYFFRGS